LISFFLPPRRRCKRPQDASSFFSSRFSRPWRKAVSFPGSGGQRGAHSGLSDSFFLPSVSLRFLASVRPPFFLVCHHHALCPSITKPDRKRVCCPPRPLCFPFCLPLPQRITYSRKRTASPFFPLLPLWLLPPLFFLRSMDRNVRQLPPLFP